MVCDVRVQGSIFGLSKSEVKSIPTLVGIGAYILNENTAYRFTNAKQMNSGYHCCFIIPGHFVHNIIVIDLDIKSSSISMF